MAFDDIFDFMSGAGWYQVSVYMLLGLPSFWGGVQSILMTFLGPDQDHWCYVESLQGYCNDWQRHVAIPLDDDGQYDRCHYYDIDYDSLTREQIALVSQLLAVGHVLEHHDVLPGDLVE